MTRRSIKTAWAGTIAGIGLVTGAFLGDIDRLDRIVQVLSGLALIALGAFARDDDVSSEGYTAPKDIPKPPDP